MKKGCGKMLEISEDRDCGVYCPFCKEKHFCINCGGDLKLHRVQLNMDARKK